MSGSSSVLEILGPVTLQGDVRVEGAKNAALPCLAAGLMTVETVEFTNVPDVIDIHNLIGVLRSLGVHAEMRRGRARIQAEHVTAMEPAADLVRRLRASFLVLGPLGVRLGRARAAYPGGCAIGARPVDQHLKGLAAFGFDVTVHDEVVEIRGGSLHGADFRFDLKTVTGTEHLLLTAAGIADVTVLENCAREPEIVQLAEMLHTMGAEIQGAGTERIIVRGRRELGGGRFSVIPDRIEAGTYILAAVATRGRVRVHPVRREHLRALLEHLRIFEPRLVWEATDTLLVDARNRRDGVPHALRTEPFPGFPTDLQAQWMVLQTQVEGESTIEETVFPERFKHAWELQRLGARVRVNGPVAVVRGKTPLRGGDVYATDLRASAGLVIAGLVAQGRTLVHELHHLDRGYHQMDAKLRALGGRLRRFAPKVPAAAARAEPIKP